MPYAVRVVSFSSLFLTFPAFSYCPWAMAKCDGHFIAFRRRAWFDKSFQFFISPARVRAQLRPSMPSSSLPLVSPQMLVYSRIMALASKESIISLLRIMRIIVSNSVRQSSPAAFLFIYRRHIFLLFTLKFLVTSLLGQYVSYIVKLRPSLSISN